MSDAPVRKGLPDWLGPLALAILPLLGWWTYGLFDVDEGFYGAVVAEMNRRGEWLTPLYNGHPWFEKPILLYWLAKPSVAAFGVWVGPRLPSVLATIGTYGLVLQFARRHLSWDAAKMSLIALSSSLLFVGAGRMMLTDPLLVLCLTGAVFSFWDSLVTAAKWRVVTAFWLGLSVLAKGPVGLVLFALLAGAVFWLAPHLRPRFRGWWLVGILVLIATIATWYLPAYLANRDVFVQKFLIEQNLNRFTGGDAAHTMKGIPGLAFYFAAILVGMAPWSVVALIGRPRGSDFELKRYLAVWAIVVFVFFTISSAKLVHYVLPCFVPLAILAGDWLASRPKPAAERWRKFGVGWTLAVAVIANVAFFAYYQKSNAELHAIAAYAKSKGGEVAVYRMSRQDGTTAQISTTLQETAHPSLLLYLDRDVLDTDDFGEVIRGPLPLWVITRVGRITDADVQNATLDGLRLEPVATGRPAVDYAIWSLRRR